MFDPNKYDKEDSREKKSGSFSEKRDQIIKYLLSFRPLIEKECEMLDDYVEKNPGSKAVEPFRKKVTGWSKILNGLDIVKEMYEIV